MPCEPYESDNPQFDHLIGNMDSDETPLVRKNASASPVPAVPNDQPGVCDHPLWRLLNDGDMECRDCGLIEDQGDDDDDDE